MGPDHIQIYKSFQYYVAIKNYMISYCDQGTSQKLEALINACLLLHSIKLPVTTVLLALCVCICACSHLQIQAAGVSMCASVR